MAKPILVRPSEKPGLAPPAFQFLLAAGGDLNMRLFVKVVSFFGTIVIKLWWKRQ